MVAVDLISLVRQRTGLCAFVIRTPEDEAVPAVERIALAQLPRSLLAERDSLLADWDSLRDARDVGSVWPAFWRVFWATLSEAQDQSPLAMPRQVAAAAPPAATAAHPRAFRGTKYQPPKQSALELDLCGWLADNRLLDALFARHDFSQLPVLGPDGARLALLNGPMEIPTTAGLLAHRMGVLPEQCPALPAAFRRALFWHCRGRPLADTLSWLQAWRALDHANQGADGTLLARLCALDASAHQWAGLVSSLSMSRQSAFLKALLKTRAYLQPIEAFTRDQLTELDSLAGDDARFAVYITALLSNLGRKVSASYTLAGCFLASSQPDEHSLASCFHVLLVDAGSAEVPLGDILRMSQALGPDQQHWVLRAWKLCGKLTGFGQVVRDTPWEQLSPVATDRWMAIFVRVTWDATGEDDLALRWRSHFALLPTWRRVLARLCGPWQEKYVRMLDSYADGWENSDTLRASAPVLLPLQERLCNSPFSPEADGDCVLSSLAVNLTPDGWHELLAVSDATWLVIERACRRKTDTMLIRRGIYSMTQCMPRFVMHTLTNATSALMRVARLLGGLAYERRRQFLAEAVHERWFSSDWTGLDPYAASIQILHLSVASGLNSPLPRRLRDHIEGRAELAATQIARHCKVTLARLPHTQLAALEQKIWHIIDGPFQLREHSAAASHAVRLLAGLDENRPGLRRFLRQYRDGQAHAYRDHPLNQAWFARHPGIDAVYWSTLPLVQHVEGADGIFLALETDPLEILMLGTYVGSCLSLGGTFDYSAVACLLDANKQVIYARNDKGRVLARQLLGIDEKDRLVCFGVYPDTASERVVTAFRAFDEAVARALGIPMFRYTDEERYEVPPILAQDWYDDGAWCPDDSEKMEG